QQIAAITASAKAFVEAFHKGDAKAVAAFWTPDGDYVDEHGRLVKGRKAIEDSFAELFAENKGLKLRIDVASVRFPAPDLAIEDGTSTVFAPDGSAPSRARYSNVLIKKDGQWLLSSMREAAYTDPSNHEFLHGLDWMIGEWIWTKDGAKWMVKTKATAADGSAVTATNIITPVDAKTVTWQSKERTAGGKPLPDTKEIKMKRVEE